MNSQPWQPFNTAPRDRSILAVWGTATRGSMGYDIVRCWRDDDWRSEISGDRYPADGFTLQAWTELPSLPNAGTERPSLTET